MEGIRGRRMVAHRSGLEKCRLLRWLFLPRSTETTSKGAKIQRKVIEVRKRVWFRIHISQKSAYARVEQGRELSFLQVEPLNQLLSCQLRWGSMPEAVI